MLDQYADDHSLTIGSPLAIETPTGKTIHVHVTGILDPPKGGSPFGEISVSNATFDDVVREPRQRLFTFVNIRGGPSEANTAALETSLAAFPAAVVETRDEFRNSRTSDITQTLQILYALLGLSVIVSLFGVINTLVLSVFERTRELGMLRAIGMTRRQVRRMIRHESIVTALIGATLGIGVGMFLAVLTTTALSQVRRRLRSAVRHADRVRRHRDPRRNAGGDPAGTAGLEAEHPRRASVRVSTATGGPVRGPTAHSGRSGGRTVAIVLGAFALVVAAVGLVGGAALVAVHATQRDSDGYYGRGRRRLPRRRTGSSPEGSTSAPTGPAGSFTELASGRSA